jgi:flagellar hook-associated protein 2
MVSTQSLNSYLLPYMLSGISPVNSSLRTTSLMPQLTIYKSPSLVQAYALSQQGGQTTQQVSSVWNNFNTLNTLAKTITATDSTSAFSQRAVTSSNDTAVTATASSGSAQASLSVGVSQLAAAQQNSSTVMQSNNTDLSAGVTKSSTYSFNLTTNSGKQQTLYVNIKPGDQNQNVLQKMADAINTASSSGTATAKAKVVTSDNSGVQFSQLVITAASTGTDNGFTLSDNTGNLVTASGANAAPTVAAQNANYTLNGVAATSQSNTVNIKSANITMTLAKTTSADATLKIGQDVAGITKQMASFVNQYNATVTALKNSGLSMAPKLINRLAQSIAPQASELLNIGLTTNADHTLNFDQSTFGQALTTNPSQTKSLLSDYGDLASSVQSVARNIIALPPTWLANTQNVYPGTDSTQSPAGQFQQYIQNTMFGMFFGSSGSYLNISA